MSDIVIDAAEARRRHVRKSDYVACKLAFIDCKKPGSHLKENYSIIGAGVTQSADQVVNLTDAHGFQIGAAAMPAGITNNLHIHYTAEVFLVYQGGFVFRWGDEGKDGELPGAPCDIISVPTWIFRGFSATQNARDGNPWLFAVLGGTDTGGIIWHPDIVREAGRFGLYLTKQNMMVDTTTGAKKPADAELMPLISDADRSALKRYSVEEMRQRVVSAKERQWSQRALLCTVLPGHACEMAPVIGHGVSEDRDMMPRITNPHGFSIEWLRIPSGQSLPRHRLGSKQVLMVFSGGATLALNEGSSRVEVAIGGKDTYSVPAGVWRELRNTGKESAEIVLVTTGDGKKAIDWAPEVKKAARATGFGVDHNGYVAPLRLLPMSVQMQA